MQPQAEDELLLWRRYRDSSDRDAREELLARHLPYARVIAAALFARRHFDDVEFDEYLQWARLGLLEAFERYEPGRGAQFRTFAALRMRGAVLDGLAALTERQSQLSARQRLLGQRSRSLTHDAARPPDSNHVLAYLAEVGMALAIGFMLEDTALFQPAGEGIIGGDSVYQAVEVRRLSERVGATVGRLPRSEREVIHGHYLQGLPFDDIARTLGVTRGRVSQIHKQALATLRKMISARQPCDITA